MTRHDSVEAKPVDVRPVTPDRLADLSALFGTNKTTNGCYCVWFMVSAKQCHAGWSGGNKVAFETMARAADEPVGLLAYRDEEPIGWCATGPLPRYERALRIPTLKERDSTQDPRVWLVPCFFVRVGFRRQGVTRALLAGAVELAREYGADAIQGFPLAAGPKRASADAYLGVETLFASCGFDAVSRPSPARVIMRRDLRTT